MTAVEHQHDHPDVFCRACVEFGEAIITERVRGLVDAWSDPTWRGHDSAAPFVRALRKALGA